MQITSTVSDNIRVYSIENSSLRDWVYVNVLRKPNDDLPKHKRTYTDLFIDGTEVHFIGRVLINSETKESYKRVWNPLAYGLEGQVVLHTNNFCIFKA